MTDDLIRFTASIEADAEDRGRFTARLVPFDTPAPYGPGRTVRFARGGLTWPETVPLTIDHGEQVADRIGVMVRSWETDTAAFGEFLLADTAAGRDVREQLRLGAVRDVSIGVETIDRGDDDLTMTGQVDHVSIVTRGRFGRTADPSRVLTVNQTGADPVTDTPNTDPAPEVVTYDDGELRAELVRLADQVDELQAESGDHPYSGVPLGVMADRIVRAQAGDQTARVELATMALADDTTTTAAGIVPDYYSSEILSVIDTARPWWSAMTSDPIGDTGMNVVYPRVTGGPAVGKQSAEKAEVASQATTIVPYTVPIDTYAGASDVAIQLAERSSPAFMAELFRLYASEYAQITEGAFAIATAAAANAQAPVADLSADAGATVAALTGAAKAVLTGVRRMPDRLLVGVDRWAQLASLVDSTGRPLFPFSGDGPTNAAGETSLASPAGVVRGLRLVVSADAPAESCIVAWSGAMATVEQAPIQLRAVQVGVLGYDVGVYGYAGFPAKYPAGLQSIPAA